MNLKKIKDAVISLSNDLNSLLAEEIQAAYDYFKVYPFLVGMNRPAAAEEFLKHAEEEFDHAKKIINRMNELGFDSQSQVHSSC